MFYSIEPWPTGDPALGFHGHQVVGQHRLNLQGDRDAIATRIASATHGAWDQAACFDPRHAFRARGADGTYDFLLCFACGQAKVFLPDGQIHSVLITGRADWLNEYLRAHSVPLPKN